MKALDEKVCCPSSDATEGGSGSACPPAAESVLHLEGVEARNEALAKLAKALAHPLRVSIIRRLGEVGACVNDLVDVLPVAQSTVSQHLKVLKEAGVVRGIIEGPKVCYCLEPQALSDLQALVGELS